MLQNMSRTLPPIFFLVAAFLVNLTLSRLVTLEREQIGLLKAVGYTKTTIAAHYIKFVIVIAIVGIAIGSVAGTWIGMYVTRLFGEYYRFPFLVFAKSPDVYLLAALLSLVAAIVGAIRAVREIVGLPPAVAMQPPAPPRFRHLLPAWLAVDGVVSQRSVMTLRSVVHHPVRAVFTTLGMALATGILVVSLFTRDAIEQLINVTYFMADRQDATIGFVDRRPEHVVMQVAKLPGVLAAEPYREVPARIRRGNIERRVVISGRQSDADLSRIIDVDLQPVTLPETGLAISALLAQILRVQVGEVVEIDLLDGQRRTVSLPVVALVEDYFGIKTMMNAATLARLMREAPAADGIHVSVDTNQLEVLYDALKRMPTVAGIALQRRSLTNFREFIAIIVTTMASIYTGLAGIIAFGIVYNTARISLSEHARELASLRVLGFSRGETMRMLLLELALITLIAQPPGWAIGYGLAWVMRNNLAGELMRVPLILERLTFALASAIIIVAALLSALVVRQRVNRLDLVAVLKTRD